MRGETCVARYRLGVEMQHAKAYAVFLAIVLILVALAITVDRAHACFCGVSGLPATELEASTTALPGETLRADVRSGTAGPA